MSVEYQAYTVHFHAFSLQWHNLLRRVFRTHPVAAQLQPNSFGQRWFSVAVRYKRQKTQIRIVWNLWRPRGGFEWIPPVYEPAFQHFLCATARPHFLVLELREPMGTCPGQQGIHNFLLWNYMYISCTSAAVFNISYADSYISYICSPNNLIIWFSDDRVAYGVWRLLYLVLYWASPIHCQLKVEVSLCIYVPV